MSKNFVAIGEAMIEFSELKKRQAKTPSYNLGFAGDTMNVCYYLAHYAKKVNLDVQYCTAVGDDNYSRRMKQYWEENNIKTDFVQTIPGAMPGLYLISIDPRGERHFYYYRSESAAKRIFEDRSFSSKLNELKEFNYIYFSSISLAILDSISQQKLLKIIQAAKSHGSTIIFDTNYRPALWPNVDSARNVIKQALALTNIALPTFVDEALLFDDTCPEDTIKRLSEYNIREIVVKNGDRGCLISCSGKNSTVECNPGSKVVDTTAAGDSFNAGYIAARLAGKDPEKAAKHAHSVASSVIGKSGALIPHSDIPTLD